MKTKNFKKLKKLKKYLFLISIVFCLTTFIHILYGYLYKDSEVVPVKGGTISEGIIGKKPSLNPLKPLFGNNEYILRLLYRSMLRYDIDQDKIVGDIANCDISSLVNITCVINDNAFWSNGDKITVKDIESTYNLIKETNSNPNIKSLLDGVDIEQTGNNEIVFKNKKEDVNFLNVFFQPIISNKTIDNLSMDEINGNFPYLDGLYSGNYVLNGFKNDDTLSIPKVILTRNEYFGEANISKIDIYIFPDEVSLQNNIQTINVFNDENNIFGDSVPRLQSNRYNLRQFLSIFLNINKIKNKDLRIFLLNEISRENLINTLGVLNYKPVLNPYMGDSDLKIEPQNKNFESIMASIGYKKKSILIQELKNESLKETKKDSLNISNSGKTEQDLTKDLSKIDRNNGINRYQSDSKIIKSPDYVDKYNFITKDDFKLVGKTDKNVEAVYINDYKLKGFSPGDNEFFYRIKESYDNIKEGENSYKIYFIIDSKKKFQEEINFLYYKDKNKLNSETEKFIKSLYDQEELKLKKEIESKNNLKKEQIKKTENDLQVDEKRLKKLEKLDDKLFYNKNLEPFSLVLVYLEYRKDFKYTANFIKSSLKEIGVIVDLKPLDKKSFEKKVLEKEYDMILSGIDLGYFDFNIFPHFHSGQANDGFNLSGIKKTSLDLALEESKKNIYSQEKLKELENKILDLLKQEQVVKTLYSPKENLLIDKNIKLSKTFIKLPSTSLRNQIVRDLYKKQEQIFSLKGKSVTGFLKYLFKELLGVEKKI